MRENGFFRIARSCYQCPDMVYKLKEAWIQRQILQGDTMKGTQGDRFYRTIPVGYAYSPRFQE